MKERGIIFSGPMVRALLEGKKTQTRRVVKGRPAYSPNAKHVAINPYATDGTWWQWYDSKPRFGKNGFIGKPGYHGDAAKCPYGVPGDRLWVRESYRAFVFDDPHIEYRAGGIGFEGDERCYTIGGGSYAEAQRQWDAGPKQITPDWRPSIHMPRWASRLTLEITDVRAERLHDVLLTDIVAEGIPKDADDTLYYGERAVNGPRGAFAVLWDSINGKTFPWASNPWVWRIAFKRLA